MAGTSRLASPSPLTSPTGKLQRLPASPDRLQAQSLARGNLSPSAAQLLEVRQPWALWGGGRAEAMSAVGRQASDALAQAALAAGILACTRACGECWTGTLTPAHALVRAAEAAGGVTACSHAGCAWGRGGVARRHALPGWLSHRRCRPQLMPTCSGPRRPPAQCRRCQPSMEAPLNRPPAQCGRCQPSMKAPLTRPPAQCGRCQPSTRPPTPPPSSTATPPHRQQHPRLQQRPALSMPRQIRAHALCLHARACRRTAGLACMPANDNEDNECNHGYEAIAASSPAHRFTCTWVRAQPLTAGHVAGGPRPGTTHRQPWRTPAFARVGAHGTRTCLADWHCSVTRTGLEGAGRDPHNSGRRGTPPPPPPRKVAGVYAGGLIASRQR